MTGQFLHKQKILLGICANLKIACRKRDEKCRRFSDDAREDKWQSNESFVENEQHGNYKPNGVPSEKYTVQCSLFSHYSKT